MRQLTARSFKVGPVAGDGGTAAANIRHALTLGLSDFHPLPVEHDGHFVLCGSGPSLPSFLNDLREERRQGRTICAVKGAHDFLCENGLEPDLFVSCEPRIRPLKYPNKRTAYLLASRCPPELFEQVKGLKVLLWHSWASRPGAPEPTSPNPSWEDFHPAEECEEWKGKGEGVGGGTTSGLRAMMLGFLMGFRKMTLYGMDSCLAKDNYTKRFTGENIGLQKPVDVIVGGKRFFCNPALAEQAMGFKQMAFAFERLAGVQIEVKGDGLLAEIMKHHRRKM